MAALQVAGIGSNYKILLTWAQMRKSWIGEIFLKTQIQEHSKLYRKKGVHTTLILIYGRKIENLGLPPETIGKLMHT